MTRRVKNCVRSFLIINISILATYAGFEIGNLIIEHLSAQYLCFIGLELGVFILAFIYAFWILD